MDRETGGSDGRLALDAFVASLRGRMAARDGGVPLPESVSDAVRQVEADIDLSECFARVAAAAGWKVHSSDAAGLVDTLVRILQAHPAASVYIEPGPHEAFSADHARALAARLREADIAVHSSSDDETLFSVDASITGAAAAIAESGSVVCQSGAATSRGASLIPPVHIAVVAQAQIVADLCDYFGDLGGSLPANINVITGPSKTADIEGIMITGVHGPGEVHVVVVFD